ncbi:MAG: hypothetical protein QOE90_3313 [Thermoplasmata archaeon]|jgi:hypothetical protein|nr:hypothetical protein [Thermoplasmata archaeon]
MLSITGKQFCIILTPEGPLKFKFLEKEHGLLHDRKEKKSYAVVREARPTNWPRRFASVYLVHESSAQTVELDGAQVTIHGATVRVLDPLRMVAKVQLPRELGGDGVEREINLTAEAIFDRTKSTQLRRLSNRRFQWYHVLLFVSLGFTIGVGLVTGIFLAGGGGHAAPPATDHPPIYVPATPPTGAQSGPITPTPATPTTPTPAPAG